MITANQIRAARHFLNLDQSSVAKAIGVSPMNISDIENEKAVARSATIDSIKKFFENRGLKFTENGGVEPANRYVTIYDGPDCYWQFLNDAEAKLEKCKGEILFSGADDSRSPSTVVEKLDAMRQAGIGMRSLIKVGDTFVRGSLQEYRWMPAGLFVDGDVKVIYEAHVAYLVSWSGTPRVIVIEDATIAKEASRHFEFVWSQASEIPESTAPERYEASDG